MSIREWRYKALIEVDQTLVDAGTLDYFPIPLTEGILPSDVFAQSRSDGGDLRVYNGNHMRQLPAHEDVGRLPLEIVTFARGGTEIWVRVPELRANHKTQLTLLFGAPTKTLAAEADPFGKHAVWDENGANNFAMVQHMSGAQATALDDSTANNNDVTGDNGTPDYNQAGTIGEAVDFERTDNEYVTVDDSATMDLLTSYTLMAWLRPESINDQGFIVRRLGGWSLYGYAAGPIGVGKAGTDEVQSAGNLTANNWWHVAGTHVGGGGETIIYRNGVADGNNPARADANNLATNIWIGGNPNAAGAGEFDGLIGEVRASSSVRTAPWLLAEYRLLNNVTNYVSVKDISRTSPLQTGHTSIAGGVSNAVW
jgi:hypothetical protein